MTPVEFLTARMIDITARARAVQAQAVTDRIDPSDPRLPQLTLAAYVLADIAAKLAVIDRHLPKGGAEDWMDAEWLADLSPEQISGYCGWCTYDNRVVYYPCPDVRLLCQPFADHPDFDPAWRP